MQGFLRDRDDVLTYLREYAAERGEDLSKRDTKKPLLKTHVLETFGARVAERTPGLSIAPILENSGVFSVRQIDEGLFKVDTAGGQVVGFLDNLFDNRYFLLHSVAHARLVDESVRKAIRQSIYLDSLWLSGLFFQELWNVSAPKLSQHRRVKFKFDFAGVFDHKRYQLPGPSDSDEEDFDDLTENSDEVFEQNISSFGLTERLGRMVTALPKLQDLLPAFKAISGMRLPSLSGPGGHDVFYNGKATNRSPSFEDHRSQVVSLTASYRGITEGLEEMVWVSAEPSRVPSNEGHVRLNGTPIFLKFKEPLPDHVFSNFIVDTFEKGKGAFRLWGNPIKVNDRKYQVYGLDLHLYQQIWLELTPRGFTVILPRGTCGNTIHRLVTNVQKCLDPEVTTIIGDTNYTKVISDGMKGGN